MRIWINILLSIFITTNLFGQGGRIDTLISQLDTTSSNRQKAEICNTIARESLPADHSKALSYAYLSLDFAVLTKDDLLIGDAYTRIANVYSFLELPEIALDYYLQAKAYLDSVPDVTEKREIHKFIGQTYTALHQFDSALVHYALSKKYCKPDQQPSCNALIDYFVGDLYLTRDLPDSAISYFSCAREQYRLQQNSNMTQECNLALAKTYQSLGEAEKAFQILTRAEQSAQEDPSSALYCRIKQELASFLLTQRKAGKAEQYLQDADSSLSLNPFLPRQIEQASLYASYYDLTAKPKEAFFARKKYQERKDSLYQQKLSTIQDVMDIRYQSESKTGELNLLEKNYQLQVVKNKKNKNLRTIGVATIIVLSLILLFVIFSLRMKRRAAKELIARKDKLQKLNKTLAAKEETSLHEKQVRDKLFSIIAENLIKPFHKLLSFTSILSEETQDYNKDEIRKYASLIQESAKNLQFLLENLLHWSRLQTGRIIFNPGYFEVKKLSNTLLLKYQIIIDKKNIAIEDTLPDESIVFADELLIELAIKNLLHNAIKYSAPGGKIQISGIRGNTSFTLRIKDEGKGISAADKAKLFDLDKHFTTKGTSGEEGTGLGLILVKEILKMHHVNLTFDTEPGKGSTFIFTLPLKKPQSSDHDSKKNDV